MTAEAANTKSAFHWNFGGWFGGQIGSTAWMLLAGLALSFQDILLAFVCLGCFIALNAFGLHLWRSRNKIAAYTAMQRFLIATTLVFAVLVIFYDSRSIVPFQTPLGNMDSQMPIWVIAFPPALMFYLFVNERMTK